MSYDRKRTKAEERELARSLATIEAMELDWEIFQRLNRDIPSGWPACTTSTR